MSAEAGLRTTRDDAHERLRAVEAAAKPQRFEMLLERHEEALLRAYRKLPVRFESDRHEAAWLYRIVHRSCLNELRARRRRRETSGLPDAPSRETTETTLASVAVAAALAELPADARAVVLLVDLIGFGRSRSPRSSSLSRSSPQVGSPACSHPEAGRQST